MTDHDPGDEDRAVLPIDWCCPFCNRELWRGSWSTPLWIESPMWSFAHAREALPTDRIDCEILRTCLRNECKLAAKMMQNASRTSDGQRQVHRILQDQMRQRGLIP